MSEESSSDVLRNVTSQLEFQKEVAVTYWEMLPVNWNVRRKCRWRIEKCYQSIGMSEWCVSDVLRNVTSQLECQKEVVVTYWEMLAVNWNVRRKWQWRIEKCYQSTGMSEGSISDVLRNFTSQFEYQKEVVVT